MEQIEITERERVGKSYYAICKKGNDYGLITFPFDGKPTITWCKDQECANALFFAMRICAKEITTEV